MNWNSLASTLIGTLVGGLVLIVIALVIHRVEPKWAGFKTLVMLGGAIMLSPVLAAIVEGLYWLARWPFTWIGDAFGTLHNSFGQDAQAIITWIGAELPWITFVVLAGLLVLAMYPRVGAVRNAQGISSKLGAVHNASHRTIWIAMFVPAAALIVIAPTLIVNPATLMHLAGK